MPADGDPPQMPIEVSRRIGYLLSRLGASARESFAAALAPLGLRPNHYGALALLERQQPAAQQALATGLRVDRSLIVGIVDHLEGLGAVQRRPDPVDRRRHALHMTPKGQELFERASTIAEELQQQRLRPLNPQQRNELLSLLTILAQHESEIGRGMAPTSTNAEPRERTTGVPA